MKKNRLLGSEKLCGWWTRTDDDPAKRHWQKAKDNLIVAVVFGFLGFVVVLIRCVVTGEKLW